MENHHSYRKSSFLIDVSTITWMDLGVPSGKHTTKLWNITMLSMGKSTFSTGPFSSSQTVDISRGYSNATGMHDGNALLQHFQETSQDVET